MGRRLIFCTTPEFQSNQRANITHSKYPHVRQAFLWLEAPLFVMMSLTESLLHSLWTLERPSRNVCWLNNHACILPKAVTVATHIACHLRQSAWERVNIFKLLCRSKWDLTLAVHADNGVDLSREKNESLMAVHLGKFTHFTLVVTSLNMLLQSDLTQVALCISNSWKQNSLGKHVRHKHGITDHKFKRPLGSSSLSKKTHLGPLSFGSASFHNHSMGPTILLVFLYNKEFPYMLVKLSFFFFQSWIHKSIVSGNYPYKRKK